MAYKRKAKTVMMATMPAKKRKIPHLKAHSMLRYLHIQRQT